MNAIPADQYTRYTDTGATSDERTLAVIAHLATYAYTFFPLAFLIPMVLWLVKRDQSPFLGDHAKEALNFHISIVLFILLSIPLIFAFGLGLVMLILVIPVCSLIFPGIAAYAASKGEYYRYPATFRLIS
jgi:uncharacterized Tic20 family protein